MCYPTGTITINCATYTNTINVNCATLGGIIYINYFFWRTYDHQEIDFLEEKGGTLSAYEMKWKSGKSETPGAFSKAYPNAEYQVINNANYLDFVV